MEACGDVDVMLGGGEKEEICVLLVKTWGSITPLHKSTYKIIWAGFDIVEMAFI